MNSEKAIYIGQVLNLFAFVALAVWYVVPRLRMLRACHAL
jgi:hypothetical protein